MNKIKCPGNASNAILWVFSWACLVIGMLGFIILSQWGFVHKVLRINFTPLWNLALVNDLLLITLSLVGIFASIGGKKYE